MYVNVIEASERKLAGRVAPALALALAALLTWLAPPAPAAGARAELAMPFKSAVPGAQTGLNLDLRYLDAQNPNAKPPTIQKLALHLPPGTRLDPSALPYCTATDQEIQQRGRAACPPGSQVGTGRIDVYLGAPGDPQTTDVALFNAPGQIIEVLFFEGTNVTAAIEHLYIEGTTIRAQTAQVPAGAPPERRFSASHIVWDIPPNGGYLVTPPDCPPDGLWRARGEFEFAEGSAAVAAATQSCRGGSDHGLRVSAIPRTLVRGRPTRLRVRVTAGDPACVRGATVRLGTRRARTDRRGRATLRVVVRKRRRVVVHVVTRRCGKARTELRTRSGR